MKRAFALGLCLLLFCACFSVPASAADTDYILDNGERVSLSKTYVWRETVSVFGEYGALNHPEDLFVDENDNLYIADTGNNGILMLDADRNVRLSLRFGEEDTDARRLNAPGGIYADSDGDLYVGDTGNSRILHLAADGTLIESFGVPESTVFDKSFIYSPRRVAVTDTGYLYTIKEKSLMKIDSENRFQGYIGATVLPFSFKNLMIRLFASKEQKSKLLTAEPPAYLSFSLAHDGELYATTTDSDRGQIMKLDVTGANQFPSVFYGEYTTDAEGQRTAPYFSDITADQNGIVTALEQNSGKMYQYDAEGNLLAVFGYGIGTMKGQMKIPTAIDVDSKGNLYVLDSQLGAVLIYEPTAFIGEVHSAVQLYADGKYRQAEEAFSKVLLADGNYDLAYEALGRVAVKQKDYRGAMESYRLANDKGGYSAAFAKYRHECFRKYFVWIVLAFVAVLVGLYFLCGALKRGSAKIRTAYYKGTVRRGPFFFCPNLLCMICEPQEACHTVKVYRKERKFASLLVVWLGLIAVRIVSLLITHYPLESTALSSGGFFLQALLVLLCIFTVTVATFAVTAIFGGESTLYEILNLTTYAAVPYLVLQLPISLLSRILCANEAGFYGALTAAMWIWMIILLLYCLKYSNGYFFGKMVLVAVVIVFAMALLWAIILLMYALGGQAVRFIADVVREAAYAVERGVLS